MIRGIHGLLYSSNPEATRAFFRDLVRLPGSDVGGGWWIFDFAEGDLGIHPAADPDEPGLHDVSFYCDDIEGTVRDMKARGVVFAAPIADHGYGLVTFFEAPGGIQVQLYEPRYVKRTKKPSKPPAKTMTKAKPKAKRTGKRTSAKRSKRGR